MLIHNLDTIFHHATVFYIEVWTDTAYFFAPLYIFFNIHITFDNCKTRKYLINEKKFILA
jgi:hypothetical protein